MEDEVEAAGESSVVPSDFAVLDELARVLGSRVVRRAEKSRDFLEYVVTETLAGRSERIKERTVGRRALDLPETYDSRLDASVRVRAARVRKALEQYYAEEGKDDPVIIELPAGTYVPKFAWRSPSPTDRPPSPTSVSVDVVAGSGITPRGAARLKNVLTGALAFYPTLTVVRDGGDRDVARYRLRVTTETGDSGPDWVVELHDELLDALIWQEKTAQGTTKASDLAAHVATLLGDYGGLIPLRAGAEGWDSAMDPVAWATVQFYRWAESHNVDQLRSAIGALDSGIVAAPENVLLHAYAAAARAELVLAGAAEVEPVLSQADTLIKRGRVLSPDHPSPTLAQAMVSLARGRAEDAKSDVRSVLGLPSLDPSLAFAAGVILAASGEVTEGSALVRGFDRSHGSSAGYQHVYLTVDRLTAGDHHGAMAHALLIPQVADIRPLLHAVTLDALGQRRQALALMQRHPSRGAQQAEYWQSLLRRMWDIPPGWREDLMVRVDALLESETA